MALNIDSEAETETHFEGLKAFSKILEKWQLQNLQIDFYHS